jgi:hypothetical protein
MGVTPIGLTYSYGWQTVEGLLKKMNIAKYTAEWSNIVIRCSKFILKTTRYGVNVTCEWKKIPLK